MSETAPTIWTPELVAIIRRQFTLDWRGIHGAGHWSRVRTIGLRLAASTGANAAVVEYFSLLHDSRRQNDGYDHGHGLRAAEYATELRSTEVREAWIRLGDADFERLTLALGGHSDGELSDDATVQTCWDADRLDLGRVGIVPDPKYLGTRAARDPAMIDWAYERSVAADRVRR